MTIDEDDTIVTEEIEEEEIESDKEVVETPKKRKKITKEDPNKRLKEFDEEFTFSFDGGSDGKKNNQNVWDFSAARENLKTKTVDRASLDDIIAKKREEKKERKRQEREDKVDEEDLALDGFGAGAERIEQDDDETSSEEEEDEEETEQIEQNSDEEEVKDEAEEQRKKEYFADETDEVAKEHDSFSSMNLSRPILKGLASVGFIKPTDIQSRTIPVALMGKDICGGAVTGSGKTAAFIVPILERLLYRPRQTPTTRVLILCPTRELAAQVHSVAVKLANYTDISFCLAVGGLNLKGQEKELKLKPDVVVATPGRLIDHIRNSSGFHLENCEILVMDEADRMLEDGFTDELDEIVKSCPRSRQTMLFSATMTDNVDQLIRMSLQNPVRLFVDSGNQAAHRLTQEFVRIRQNREGDRPAILLALCRKSFKNKVIIFFRSKAAAHQMKILFGLMGLNSAELHGNLTQEQRLESLEKFRDGEVDYLLATDLAARGLDIKGIETVINYNMPTQFPQYLHRVGRTARAGRNGRAVTLVGETDRKMLKLAIKSSVSNQVKNRVVPSEVVQRYKSKIEGLNEEIKEVLAEEKQEKEIRNAEMKIKKTENMILHSDEIKSRPARTWFQSDDQKKKGQQKKSRR
ncbi:P-loop containing nucleoside triphosphate hydrolase protein [Pilobolus umbonatus]|nr:P-loop containing nucleoside triphosphate hydrolase protein [Pilobolus umbonatus]